MDFKSLMSAQIASAKPESKPNKYQRRGDAQQQQEAKYAAEQAELERQRAERLDKKRKHEEEQSRLDAIRDEKKRRLAEESKARREAEEAEEERKKRQRLGLPEQHPTANGADEDGSSTPLPEDMPDIPDEELRIRLRGLNEPITLYDEDHTARLRRYYKLTNKSVSNKPKLYPGPIPTILEPLPEKEVHIPTPLPAPNQPEAYTLLPRQITCYLTLLLQTWHSSLAARPPSVANSAPGRTALQTYHTTVSDLTPLYRSLESSDPATSLPPTLLHPLATIIRHAQDRRYRDATDAYLQLSIGKAAWPIGVTMVGIHERSARQKLHENDENKTAHIMSDEGTRRWLQSVKRCLTFAQGVWGPTDVGQLMG